jgi:hypothetical protein
MYGTLVMRRCARYKYGPVRSLFFPFFSLGHFLFLVALIVGYTILAFMEDLDLFLFLGFGSYFGVVVVSALMGLAPGEVEITSCDGQAVTNLLNNEVLLIKLSDRIWAPRSSKSKFFRSDWITLEKGPSDGVITLTGRCRDLRLILAKMREGLD